MQIEDFYGLEKMVLGQVLIQLLEQVIVIQLTTVVVMVVMLFHSLVLMVQTIIQ